VADDANALDSAKLEHTLPAIHPSILLQEKFDLKYNQPRIPNITITIIYLFIDE
jgi:hypothetical protein